MTAIAIKKTQENLEHRREAEQVKKNQQLNE